VTKEKDHPFRKSLFCVLLYKEKTGFFGHPVQVMLHILFCLFKHLMMLKISPSVVILYKVCDWLKKVSLLFQKLHLLRVEIHQI